VGCCRTHDQCQAAPRAGPRSACPRYAAVSLRVRYTEGCAWGNLHRTMVRPSPTGQAVLGSSLDAAAGIFLVLSKIDITAASAALALSAVRLPSMVWR
jgi:hypothetical protein